MTQLLAFGVAIVGAAIATYWVLAVLNYRADTGGWTDDLPSEDDTT